MLSSQKATLEFKKKCHKQLTPEDNHPIHALHEGGDTLDNFVACNSCRKQIARCVVLCSTRGTPLMFHGNKVAWNRQLVYSGKHVASNKLCATLSPMTHLASARRLLAAWVAMTHYAICCTVVATKLPSVSPP